MACCFMHRGVFSESPGQIAPAPGACLLISKNSTVTQVSGVCGENLVQLFLPTSLRSSPVSTPEPDEYNAKNTLFLIVGQALFIPLAGLISYLVPKLSIFSAGTLTPLTSPVFGSVAVSGALYVLPLGAFVLLTSSLER